MEKKVAIVILNWNGEKMLREYLPSVLRYSKDEATVYVADNASTDGSLALLRQHFQEVRLIVLDKNWGFAEGYNRALREIEAEYYLLLNSDIEVTHHWLTPMIEYLDSHPDVAACQPKLLSIFDKDQFEYAGASGGYLDTYGYPFCRGRVFETVEADNGQYDTLADVLWATGAALMIRSKDYWDVDGLDGRFFAHNEEIDLCWRLRIKGRRIVCLPESQVYHVGGGTLPKWWLDYLAAWEMLILKRNVGDFRAVYRARRAFKHWRKDFEADRKKIQASRVDKRVPERKDFSLLWQYYVKGRKTFSTLPE